MAGEGVCCVCRQWRTLGGNHRIKRRYLATRHDLTKIDPCCWPCNVALESLGIEELLRLYPNSAYRDDWIARFCAKYGREPDTDGR